MQRQSLRENQSRLKSLYDGLCPNLSLFLRSTRRRTASVAPRTPLLLYIVTSTSEERFRPMHKLTGSKKRSKIQICVRKRRLLLKAGTADCVCFSYYMSGNNHDIETGRRPTHRRYPSRKIVRNPYIIKTDWGWPIDPVDFAMF